jgi:hypothetical protein
MSFSLNGGRILAVVATRVIEVSMSGLSAYLCRVETVVWSSEVARCWPGEVRLAGGDGAELVEMLGFVRGSSSL